MKAREPTISPEVRCFVMRAVQLPPHRLATLRSRVLGGAWVLHDGTVGEVMNGYARGREQTAELRRFIEAEAAATAQPVRGQLRPEDIAEAVLPAARALMLRDMLETALPDGRRQRAFRALLEPFADVLPGIVDGLDPPGEVLG